MLDQPAIFKQPQLNLSNLSTSKISPVPTNNQINPQFAAMDIAALKSSNSLISLNVQMGSLSDLGYQTPPDILTSTSAMCKDDISTTRSPILAILTPVSIASAIKEGKIQTITATTLLAHLSGQSSDRWGGVDFLLVDMRDGESFYGASLLDSINPCFPALVTKRLKKKMFSNFNLGNFLSHSSCLARFRDWKNGPGKKGVLVYDEMMYNYDGTAWTFIEALKDGIADDMLGENKPVIAYLENGIDAMLGLNDSRKFFKFEEHVVLEMVSNLVGGGRMASSPDMVSSSSSIINSVGNTPLRSQTEKKGSFRSLQIDVFAKKESVSRRPTLNLFINDGNSIATNEECVNSAISSASPNDNAAPPDPYSIVNKNLLLGSDVLPLSPQGPQLLQDIGVTHILNMAAEIKNSKLVEDCGHFKIKWIPVLDNTEVDMDEALQDAILFIGTELINAR